MAEGFRSFLYWSDEKFALKPVISVTQEVIWSNRSVNPSIAFVAGKQIYASHYFEASLSVTILIDDSAPGDPATWVLYINRSHIDAFDGWFGGLKRSLATSRLPGELRNTLAETKKKLESRYLSGR